MKKYFTYKRDVRTYWLCLAFEKPFWFYLSLNIPKIRFWSSFGLLRHEGRLCFRRPLLRFPEKVVCTLEGEYIPAKDYSLEVHGQIH